MHYLFLHEGDMEFHTELVHKTITPKLLSLPSCLFRLGMNVLAAGAGSHNEEDPRHN